MMVATGAYASAPFPDPAGAGGSAADGGPGYMADRLLVQLKPASAGRAGLKSGRTSQSALLGVSSLDAIGAQVGAIRAVPAIEAARNSARGSELGLDRWMLIELAPGADVEAAIAAYRADPNVDAAERDYLFELMVTPNDPLYPPHWGHNNRGQLRAFNYNSGQHTGPLVGTVGFDSNAEVGWTGPNGFGVASTIIAILDTGVNLSHPDLNVISGYDAGDNDFNPEDDSVSPDAGHGTGCAGLAAGKANNSIGSCGSAPGCSIMPIKVSNTAGQLPTTAVANALIWAADHGADIVSMSFGFGLHGTPPAWVESAIEYANAAGVVMFAGTGNNNNFVLYPASNPHVISVGAASPCGGRKRSAASTAFLAPGVSADPNNYTCDNQRWWGSNFGPATKDAPNATDIIAPTILPTTDIQGAGGFTAGDYSGYFNGASCSTPYVAGVAALIKSKHPDWTPAQVRKQLLESAQDVINVESGAGWDRYSGYGLVDINAAVGCSAQPVIVGNGGITASADANCCVMIHPADLIASVSDPDGDEDIVSVRITRVGDTEMNVDSTLVCGAGTQSVQVTVTDYCGNTASVLVDVEIQDVTPPSITVVMDRNALWPPNHKMVAVCADITATDGCDAEPEVALVSVVSNEPDNARGEGNTVGDIGGADVGTDDRCFDLRSERRGGEDGRVYTIVYSATDVAGNVAYDTVEVHVPHNTQPAAAISSSGFTPDGTGLNAGAATFALFVTGSAALDVRRIDTANLYVGNTAGVVKAKSTRVVDINSDQKADLAVFFDARQAENVTISDEKLHAKAANDGPLGMHFTLDDGTAYLVGNIYALGAPVEMPSVTGKKTVTPDQPEITPKTGPVAAAPTVARITALTSIQPNPFNPQTSVHFSLANNERVRIAIYDVTGARVRELLDETMASGQHQVPWDGRSDRGTGVTSGVYFVRMTAGSYSEVRKIVMLK